MEVIGEGAFGIISKAKDRRTGAHVAIKTMYRSMVDEVYPG
jgi:hypothetical protein